MEPQTKQAVTAPTDRVGAHRIGVVFVMKPHRIGGAAVRVPGIRQIEHMVGDASSPAAIAARRISRTARRSSTVQPLYEPILYFMPLASLPDEG